MSAPIELLVLGAGGRMGRAVIAEAEADDAFTIVAAVERPGSPALGERLGRDRVPVTGELAERVANADVVIDFSTPASCARAARVCAQANTALVSGTTGLGEPERAALKEASHSVPVLWSANFSVGVAIVERLVELAARASGASWDLEVIEAHHRHKIDAPSGTALAIARAAARGRGLDEDLTKTIAPERRGPIGPRGEASIGMSVVRGGSIVGEHELWVVGEGERIEIAHRAHDRAIFARGALRAAAWLSARPPGSYAFADALF